MSQCDIVLEHMDISEIDLWRAALRGFREDRQKIDTQIRAVEAHILSLGTTVVQPTVSNEAPANEPPVIDPNTGKPLSKKQLAWRTKHEQRADMATRQKRKWHERYTLVACPACRAAPNQPCVGVPDDLEVHKERRAAWSKAGGFKLLAKRKR